MSDARPIRFNRTLFSVPMNGHAPIKMVAHLAAEDIELILDIRNTSAAARQFEQICEDAAIYYIHKPILSSSSSEAKTADNDVVDATTWVAGLSLRHRTCVIGDDDDHRLALSRKIAKTAGQRLIDIEESPAQVAIQNENE